MFEEKQNLSRFKLLVPTEDTPLSLKATSATFKLAIYSLFGNMTYTHTF